MMNVIMKMVEWTHCRQYILNNVFMIIQYFI